VEIVGEFLVMFFKEHLGGSFDSFGSNSTHVIFMINIKYLFNQK
jgi:hypothetical protein